MNMQSMLRSFTMIACGALLLALLAGLLIGSITGGRPRPLPYEGIDAPPPPAKPLPIKPPPLREKPPTPPPEMPKGPDTPVKPPPDKPVKVKPSTPVTFDVPPVRPPELKEGRTDEIATLDHPVEVKGSILVEVRNHRDTLLGHASLRIEVNGGPLGWLAVRSAVAEPVRDTPGQWRYNNVMAGRYRVSSMAANYTAASQELELTANALSATVVLKHEQPRSITIEFSIRLPDGNVPSEVQIRQTDRAGNPNRVNGRFGEHVLGSAGVPGYGTRSSRYKMPDTGVVPWTFNSGSQMDFEFTHEKASKTWYAKLRLDNPTAGQRFDVELAESEASGDVGMAPMSGVLANVHLTFTRNDGASLTITRANLRQKLDQPEYMDTTEVVGSRASWINVQPGRWFVVVEAGELDAFFVAPVSVSGDVVQTFNIDVARVVVRAGRDPGSPARDNAPATFQLRIRPQGSGELEKTFGRELPAGQKGDSATYNLPAGPYVLLAQSTDKGLGVEPEQRSIKVAAGSETTLDFTIRAACALTFVCVDTQGVAIAGVEYLISFNPAGDLKENEKANVKLSGPDGRCAVPGAPYGAVYLHIWTASTDWQRPDKVFRIDMPAYGEKDLGAVVLNR
ncbi:MAG: hypothetical protein IT462_11385 [Planctomycetes bacterium]|nr:hypothetical protein [Planctomycetota bacterium]